MLVLKDGTRVPGATTILKLLDKSFLIKWANKLGKQNIDVEDYVQHSAKSGELIHKIIESHLTKTPLDISEYSDEELSVAEQAFNRYLSWEEQHTLEEVEIEKELVSEAYKFGGLLDIYCKLDGEYTVIDLKTSKSIGSEQLLQVSSYEQLLRENNLKVDKMMIINVGKLADSKLQIEELSTQDSSKYFKMFKALVDVYYAKKELDWKG